MSKAPGDNPKEGKSSTSTAYMVRLVARYMGTENRFFSLAGLMLIFEAATAVLIPLLVAFVIDYLAARISQIDGKVILPPASPLQMIGLPTLINPDIDTMAIITLGIILLTMINSLADSLAEIYLAQGGRRLGFNLRVSLYSHLQKLSLAFHDQRRTGDILTRVTSDVAALEDFIISSLSDFVGSVLLITFILVAMLINAWQVALVAAVIIPVMAVVSNYFTSRIKAASKKRRTSEGELASATQEMLTSIRVIQTYGLGSYEQAMFARQSQKAMDAALEAARYQAKFSWVVSVLGALSIAAVIWMAVFLIFRAPVSIAGIGLLTAYVKYIQDMFKPTKKIIQEWNTFGKLYASVERIGDLLEMEPAIQDRPDAVEAPPLKGRVEFRGVGFSYQPVSADKEKPSLSARKALQDVNFVIEPGEVVALVGQTGAGKSTIVQLLPRLYDPTEGQILIDGRDSRDYTLDSLRSQISMVLQESILFTGSVVENIAYGRPDSSGREIITAAMQANAHEFIEKLPEGYYTMLGERGSNLSGGQRQRIAIARAFVRKTSILILDEPTTGLDAESTDLVLKALRKLMKGKTTIIISHDLNLIRNADKIIVINHGTVEAIGTHEALVQTDGLYSTLYTMQTGQAAPAAAVQESKKVQQEPEILTPALDAEFDLPRHPGFLKRLPALEDAFDPGMMQGLLQRALFGNKGSGYSIESCVPGKALYLPGDICTMQYNLNIREDSQDQAFPVLVNARLFTDLDAAMAFRRKNLDPLIQPSRRLDFEAFSSPVGVIDEMRMAYAVFPVDGDIPSLVEATRPERMLPVFKQTLPEALSGEVEIDSFRLEPAHYGRFQRCVLRYRLIGRSTGTQAPTEQVVYGKVDADGLGGLTVPVIASLREELHSSKALTPFRIPRTLGYLPEMNLLLMEALPGSPQLAPLIRSRVRGKDPEANGGLSLEKSIETSARIAAAFHRSGISLGRKRTFEGEITHLNELLKPILEITPALGNRLGDGLDAAVQLGSSSAALPMAFSHGDYTHTQLIFSGQEAGLVDFDTVCQAEPALDVGQFLAYQRLSLRKEQLGGSGSGSRFSQEQAEALCERFLASYLQAAGWGAQAGQVRARVGVYELISLVRLGAHSWQKLKGARLQAAVSVLQERLASLARVS